MTWASIFLLLFLPLFKSDYEQETGEPSFGDHMRSFYFLWSYVACDVHDVYMCVHMCRDGYLSTRACAYMWGCQTVICCLLHFLYTLFIETRSLPELRTFKFQLVWLTSMLKPLYPPLHGWNYSLLPYLPSLGMSSRNPNSGPHTWRLSNLSIECSLQPSFAGPVLPEMDSIRANLIMQYPV